MNFVSSLYKRWEINSTTLSGAIDVVVVEQPDGTFTCSPFHVRFGQMGVLRSKAQEVDIEINGEPIDIHMKLGESGEAYFEQEVPADELSVGSTKTASSCSLADRTKSTFIHSEVKDILPVEHPTKSNCENQNTVRLYVSPLESLSEDEQSDEKRVVGQFQAEISTMESALEDETSLHDVIKEQEETLPEASNIFTVQMGRVEEELSPAEDSSSSETASIASSKNKRKRKKRSLVRMKSKNNSLTKICKDHEEHKSNDDESTSKMEIVDQNRDISKKTNEEDISKNETSTKDSLKVSEIHFFSDSETMPSCITNENQSHLQIKSDSEYETEHKMSKVEDKGVKEDDHLKSWSWGELPTGGLQHTWWLNRLFWFMKKSHNRQSLEGIYLSDIVLDSLGSEENTYFQNNYMSQVSENTDDNNNNSKENNKAETFNSDSVEFPNAKQKPKGDENFDSDFEEQKDTFGEIMLSLCGGLTKNTTPTEEAFKHHVITYDEFVKNPTVINDPNLVVRVDNKMFNWQVAGPVILSIATFHRPLPKDVVTKLYSDLIPQGSEQRRKQKYYSWFHWGSRQNDQNPKTSAGKESNPTHIDAVVVENIAASENCKEEDTAKTDANCYKGLHSEVETNTPNKSLNSNSEFFTSDSKHLKNSQSRTSVSSERHRKALRLTSEQISRLNLIDGANEIEFSVTTALQGTTKCKCFLFKWRYDDKIVISDIDGTITKSDVLGHILYLVGKDWSQKGVAKLFTKIKENGYKLLYLSARAIGQSDNTRGYLTSLKQEDFPLPEGPMLLNPTGLISAIYMDSIEKKPERFKISCLKDIQALFPPNRQPFYAGYGNRINDAWAYRAIGIPMVRIFTINHRGEIRNELSQTFQSSFPNMTQIVNQMFPAMLHNDNLVEDFSQFIYWRDPIPELGLSEICIIKSK